MRFLIDSHTHTVASGHAYHTLGEMAAAARDRGIQVLGITEHGPQIPGSCNPIYFANYHALDRDLYAGLLLVMGAELDILDYDGRVDLTERQMKWTDLGIASIHPNVSSGEAYPPYVPGSVKENTGAYLNAMENPAVEIIGHPDDARVPVDYEELARHARDARVLLELNAASLHPSNVRGRGGSAENMKKMLHFCEKWGAPVIVNSDAHSAGRIGRFERVEEILAETGFPEELVVNGDVEKYMRYLHGSAQRAG